jgi:hypothetical protein
MKTTFVLGENTLVYNRFINPVNGLNNMFGKQWMGWLVGNTPEVMLLHTRLFQDVKESVQTLTIREPGVKDDHLFLMTTAQGCMAYILSGF